MVTYYIKSSADPKQEVLDPVWVDGKASEAAKSFFPGKDDIKSSQLRKFYDDVKNLERKWRVKGASDVAFTEILPMIKLLKAKSDYAWKRKVVPTSFKSWLWEHVDSIKTPRDFEAFLVHFEAVVGFSYGFAKDGFA